MAVGLYGVDERQQWGHAVPCAEAGCEEICQ